MVEGCRVVAALLLGMPGARGDAQFQLVWWLINYLTAQLRVAHIKRPPARQRETESEREGERGGEEWRQTGPSRIEPTKGVERCVG